MQGGKRDGQVMLLTVLILSAVFLGSAVIAGLLMVYQLQQITRVIDSTKSIFAAETGIERGLFRIYRCGTVNGVVFGNNPAPVVPLGWNLTKFQDLCSEAGQEFTNGISTNNPPFFFNNANYHLTIDSGTGKHDPDATPLTAQTVNATGRSGKSARALQIQF